jgi:MFS superfamily sulfate permease-like transporter
MKFEGSWKADISAGASAALVALPVAIGGGILTTASLGPEYASIGVKAGLISAVIAALVTALAGSSKYLIGGPSAATSIVLSAGIAQIIGGEGASLSRIMLLMLLIVALSGSVLVLAGALRWGSFIKFIPRPVTAGFVNGIALLVAYSQIGSALGVPGRINLFELFGQIQPGALAVSLVTVLTCIHAPRLRLPIPPTFTGMAAGFVLHFGIERVFGGGVGPLLGALPSMWGVPDWVSASLSGGLGGLPWGQIIAAAALLCIMGAVQTLMTGVALDSLSQSRHNSNRELIGFGLGNIVTALFGGTASSANLGRAMANFRGGATSRCAAFFNGLTMLFIIVAVSPLISLVPLAVMAGILIHSSIVMIDQWSIEQFRRWYKGHERGEVRENVIVIAVMTVGMLWMSPVIAVGVGVILTMGLFLKRMSKSFVRNTYTCENKRSLKVRSGVLENHLEKEGHRAHVIVLEGALFFGTADRLRAMVESHHQAASFIILDCRRVRDWDATGVQIIGQMYRSLGLQGCQLLLAHVTGKKRTEQALRAYGLHDTIPARNLFADTDRALEYAEDLLLANVISGEEAVAWLHAQLNNTVLLSGLTEADQGVLSTYFETLSIPAGDVLFRTGDQGDQLFVLLEGEITLGLPIDGQTHLRRLATITPGVVFGEMALLDAQPRSAHALADSASVLKVLSRSNFARLRDQHPSLFAIMLQNIAHEMSLRLRLSNQQLRALED